MIRYRLAMPLLALALVACKAHTDAAATSSSVDTQSAISSPSSATSADADSLSPTSGSLYDPLDPMGESPDLHSRFQIKVDFFASGRMVLALDTLWPRVETEGANPTRTVTDSLVVPGIRSGEYWTYNCTNNGQYEPFVVAMIPQVAPASNIPRVAWKFDTLTYRIRPIPTESMLCSALSD